MSSEGSDLGEQMDQLLNGGMPLSHTHDDNNDDPLKMEVRWLITTVKNQAIIAHEVMTASELISLIILII